jgi:hypothetical protein
MNRQTTFAPQLYIPNGTRDISFYAKAFGAAEVRRWANDDGTLHVAELSVDGAIFHLHEVTGKPGLFSPSEHKWYYCNHRVVCTGCRHRHAPGNSRRRNRNITRPQL